LDSCTSFSWILNFGNFNCRQAGIIIDADQLFLEIEKTHPDVVVMDLDLYAKIDGIETSRKIRCQFDVPVWYV
jgi:chemotaxis response regulator CheB